MFQKILLGIDDSEDSQVAVNKVIDIQNKYGSEVVIFHSVKHKMADFTHSSDPPVSIGTASYTSQGPGSGTIKYTLPDTRYQAAQLLLENTKLKFDFTEGKAEVRLVYDVSPQKYIREQVEKEGFDLVVLGCKGEHSKLKRTILGTIPEYVLNNVDTDVLVVK